MTDEGVARRLHRAREDELFCDMELVGRGASSLGHFVVADDAESTGRAEAVAVCCHRCVVGTLSRSLQFVIDQALAVQHDRSFVSIPFQTSGRVLEALVGFAYTGQTHITGADAVELAALADVFGIPTLIEALTPALRRFWTCHSAVATLNRAEV
jgi:hypothetical protein